MLFANVFSFSIFSWRLELLIWNYLEKDYEQQNHKTKCKYATKMDKNDVWNIQKKNENKVRNQHGRVLTHSIHTFVWNASAINLSIWITDTPKLQSGEIRAQNALVWFCCRRTKDSFFFQKQFRWAFPYCTQNNWPCLEANMHKTKQQKEKSTSCKSTCENWPKKVVKRPKMYQPYGRLIKQFANWLHMHKTGTATWISTRNGAISVLLQCFVHCVLAFIFLAQGTNRARSRAVYLYSIRISKNG